MNLVNNFKKKKKKKNNPFEERVFLNKDQRDALRNYVQQPGRLHVRNLNCLNSTAKGKAVLDIIHSTPFSDALKNLMISLSSFSSISSILPFCILHLLDLLFEQPKRHISIWDTFVRKYPS